MEIKRPSGEKGIAFPPVIFDGLPPIPEVQAVMYYNFTAQNALKTEEDKLYLEGEEKRIINTRQLFESICKLYGTEPKFITQAHWNEIRLHCFNAQLSLVSEKHRYFGG